jgi:hypothetical protein
MTFGKSRKCDDGWSRSGVRRSQHLEMCVLRDIFLYDMLGQGYKDISSMSINCEDHRSWQLIPQHALTGRYVRRVRGPMSYRAPSSASIMAGT